MVLPEKVKQRYIDKLGILIAEGSLIADSIQMVRDPTGRGWSSTTYVYNHERLSKWRTNCIALLDPFRHEGSKLIEQIDYISQASAHPNDLKTCVGILQSFKQGIEEGFLDELFLRVESEIAADYMGQARATVKGRTNR
jgi:hypothetical protein